MEFDIRKRIEATKKHIRQFLAADTSVQNRISANQWIRHPAFCAKCGIPINPEEHTCISCHTYLYDPFAYADIQTTIVTPIPAFNTDFSFPVFLNNEEFSEEEPEEKKTMPLPALEILTYLAEGAQTTEEHERLQIHKK